MKISKPPIKNERLGTARNKKILKSTTKNGQAISIIEAYDAPIFFIAEKIRKFASNANKIDTTMRIMFDFPEESKVLTES